MVDWQQQQQSYALSQESYVPPEITASKEEIAEFGQFYTCIFEFTINGNGVYL